MEINYVIGDATAPVGEGFKVIVHCCNDQGYWGKGFVLALSRKWPWMKESYLNWYARRGPLDKDFHSQISTKFELGGVELVGTGEDNTWVANLIGQHGIARSAYSEPPIRYEAIDTGFKRISDFLISARKNNPGYNSSYFSIHMPRVGCGLAGGEWNKIEQLVNLHFCSNNIPVTVYDLA